MPRLTADRYTATIALRAARRSWAIIRRSSTISALDRPCLVLAAFTRARPSAVRGPVDGPPCIRQRPFGIAGAQHGIPLRVRAPQRGCECAKARCGTRTVNADA